MPPADMPRLVIWHTEGTAISGLLSWMWRLKKSLPAAGIDLTLVSLEIQPFRFQQVCDPSHFYDVRIRTPQEFIAFLKTHRDAVHLINHAYEYVDLLEKLSPTLLGRLTLAGICHTDQDYYYHHLKRLDAHLAGVIAVSPRCRENLEELLPHRTGSIPVLPDWDLPVADTLSPRAVDANHPLRVLFNGRMLHLQKRIFDLPEISRRLAKFRAAIELTMVGDGPDLPKLREQFAQGTHVPHHFIPPCAPWDMAVLLAESDVFLQVSEFEGASVSLMEAMAAGLAPVVTNTASGTDLLRDGSNALLCPVGDVAALASALEKLSSDRTRVRKIGNTAFETARDYMRELNYAQSLKSYLQDLAPVAA